ncbi:aldose epimerase family protein [Bosea sp. (in: a-proteobacteria)]|uniref:aldose epimerase family protein n=1 Tax=Bosea sp. (in: a-proteobacteria) TaxID=1871050 RepID=UPI002FC8F9B6
MLSLAAGSYAARISPEHGGIVAALEWRGPDGRSHKLLHAPEGLAPSTAAPNKFGAWAMLPFANRAFDSVVDDGESRFTVPANDPSGTIHGFGWQSAWQMERQDPGHAVLVHRRNAGADPYRYRARQDIRLDEAGMTVTLSLTNEADTALPFGMGLHPWLPCAPDTRLGMTASGALIFGEKFRATGTQALIAGGPYAGKPVFATGTETAWSFLGWGGVARIETPSSGLAIAITASESLLCPVVWAPAGADFLCVEPQSHAAGAPSEAIVRAASPLRRLEPGETLEGWMRIAAAAL